LQLRVRRGEYRAFLYASVDGLPAADLPRAADGRTYIVLYDPLGGVDTVPLTHGLQLGEHTAEIVADRGWGQWSIVGWVVTAETAMGLPWLALALSVAVAAALGVDFWLIWPERGLLLDSAASVVRGVRSLDDRLMVAVTAGAALLLYIMVGTVPTLLALGLLGLLLLMRPETGLPVLALSLPFAQPGRPLLGKVFSMAEILTVLTTVGWLTNRVLARFYPDATGRESEAEQDSVVFSPLDWGVLFLVLWSAFSLLWSQHTRVASREFRTVILESALFYGLFRVMIRDWRDAERTVDAWVLGAAAIAAVGVTQWLLGSNVITAEGVWRVRGFYGSPNNLALYLGKVFPLAAVVGLSHGMSVSRGRRRRSWLYGASALLMAIAILLTYSRGAWLIGVPASLLLVVALRGKRAFVLAFAVLLVAGSVVALAFGADRLTSLLSTTEGTTFFRLQLWKSSLAMIRDHPVLGVGLDNFLYYYRTHYVLPTAWEEFNLSHPHNLVLDFWLRLGLPGLVALGAVLTGFFRSGLRRYAMLPEGIPRLLVLGSMAGMANLLAHGLVDNAFFLVDLAFSFMLMLALVQLKGGHSSVQRRSFAT
jgi:O-antigen ligase